EVEAASVGAEESPATLEAPRLCPHCQAPRKDEQVYCDECGWIFADAFTPAGFAQVPQQRLKERYVLAERIGTRGEIIRFRGLDQFTQDGFEYLVEELPTGQVLWDAWDDPQASAEQRFGWLKQIAGALHHLHQGGAILEGLRPDIVVVVNGEHARLTDLSDL